MWHDITDRDRPALWTFVPVQTSTRPWGTVTANNAIGYVDWPLPAHMEQVLQKCRGQADHDEAQHIFTRKPIIRKIADVVAYSAPN